MYKRQPNADNPEDADPTEGDTVGKIKAEADSTKLRNFINNLGSE